MILRRKSEFLGYPPASMANQGAGVGGTSGWLHVLSLLLAMRAVFRRRPLLAMRSMTRMKVLAGFAPKGVGFGPRPRVVSGYHPGPHPPRSLRGLPQHKENIA